MPNEDGLSEFKGSCFITLLLGFTVCVLALLINIALPDKQETEEPPVQPLTIIDLSEDTEEELSQAFHDYYKDVALNRFATKKDEGLTLYRQEFSQAAVEWFYTQITGNKEVTKAILTEAEVNNISLSLAFALAHTESSYNARAVNRNNSNATIDRGLFQLNSNSFPGLTESDFFDPYTSAKYGLSHLRYCLNTAGNEVSALAMYNAGTTRVRSNKTPQTTLNYVGKIMTYQKMLDELFTEQVTAYFEPQLVPGIAVAYAQASR